MATQSFPPGYLEQDKGQQIVGATVAIIVLITLATILRFCSRCVQKSGIMWSDFFIPISYVSNICLAADALLAVRWGAGKHIEAVSPHNFRLFLINVRIPLPFLWCPAMAFPRLAILDLYLNVFTDKFTRYTSYSVGTVIVLTMVVNIITLLTQCHPFGQSWDPVPGGHCDNIRLHLSYSGLPNIPTDLIILLLPVRAVWKLQMTWQMKIGVILTFAMGGLGLASSIAKFVEFLEYTWNNEAADPTWQTVEPLIWVLIEPGVYHLCACLITFRPLVRWVFMEGRLSSVFSGLLYSRKGRDSSRNGSNTSSAAAENYKTGSIGSETDSNTFAPRGKGNNKTYVVNQSITGSNEAIEEGIYVSHNVSVCRDNQSVGS